jgi:hypothetical protein
MGEAFDIPSIRVHYSPPRPIVFNPDLADDIIIRTQSVVWVIPVDFISWL